MVKEIFQREFASDFELEEVRKIQGRLFDFVATGSDSLFVTIGDSWTYGARLIEESPNNNDQYRVNHCYGAVVARAFSADFLNLSVPGINNLWMVNKYLQLVRMADKLPYKNINIFMTFTEQGREIGTDFDLDPVLNDGYRQARTPRDVALALANYEADRILANQHARIQLHLACNYVNNIYPDRLQHLFMPQIWLEVLLGSNMADECFVVGSWVIPKFRDILCYNTDVDQAELLKQMTELIERGERRLYSVYNTGCTYRTGYGHPNSDGHSRWAKYIVSQLTAAKD